MEPRIQYARTSDGVSIAYAVFGDGWPVIYGPSIWNLGLHQYAHLSYSRRGVDRMGVGGLQVTRFDGRGAGSSDRDITEFSLEMALLDLEAVIERMKCERFALMGHFNGATTAIAYAARRPERVSHLILRDPFASVEDQNRMFPGNRVVTAMRPFFEQQWPLVCLNMAAVGFGLADSDLSREYAESIQSGLTPGACVRIAEAYDEIDVNGLLKDVRVPTLVVQDISLPGRAPAAAGDWGAPIKRIAASIPGAHLVSSLDVGNTAAEFVLGGSASSASERGRESAGGGLQTILFTDIEGSTALTEHLGDAAAREVLRHHERITREALGAHGGSEVKTMGDGFMASFGSASKALECAIAIQRGLAERSPSTGSGRMDGAPIRVRIGLNAGEPIAEDDPGGRSDLFGTAVIVAARIAARAHGGEILVSDVVRQLVAGKGFLFNDRGDHALKGFEDPVRVWEARWQER
jgi:class 3 adenylate cyclase